MENENRQEPTRREPSRWRLGRFASGSLAGAALAGAVLIGGSFGFGAAQPARLAASSPAFAQAGATPLADEAMANDACPDDLYGPGAEAWAQAELYFGTTQDDGYPYSDEEFLNFLDTEVTPRFPAGLTLLTGLGQWQSDEGNSSQERSQVLIILYPPDPSGATSTLLEEIRDEYEQQFNQQSVLRADTYPVCTSF